MSLLEVSGSQLMTTNDMHSSEIRVRMQYRNHRLGSMSCINK